MEILSFESIPSTNDFLKDNHGRLSDFTIAWAAFQSKGKGSHGRGWDSKAGDGLLFSILIKDKRVIAQPGLPLVAGALVGSYLESLGFAPKIKWPNDIYLGAKKVCGILCEGQPDEYVVIGIGINVNQDRFEGEYRATPSSLFLESGRKWDIQALAKPLFEHLEKGLRSPNASSDARRWICDGRDYLQGKSVLLAGRQKPVPVDQISEDMYLELKDGTIVSSSEFSIVTLK